MKDPLEWPAAAQAAPAQRHHAERAWRPFCRRALMTRLPAADFIRRRKPCTLWRCLLLG